jgi:hypothetical protein
MVPGLRLFWIPSYGIGNLIPREHFDLENRSLFFFFNPARHLASRVFLFSDNN